MRDDAHAYLISAKHVLFKDSVETHRDALKIIALDAKTNKNVSYEIDCSQLFADGNLRKHSNADVAIARIANLNKRESQTDPGFINYGMSLVPGLIEDTKDSSIIGMNPAIAARIDNVKLGSDILLLGYPTSLADPDFFEKSTPLLRTGVVAGIIGNAKIVIDCPVYFGNSGGLVLRADTSEPFTAIGVASRMVPFRENIYSAEFRRQVGTRFENSGYAIVEPMDRVFDLMDEFQK
ncbi:hypothetical protein BJS_08104 [Bradyrhizobium japonicum SEMIA 5079]|nr:hypothetical protein BJS_08104 [Bradyrhizobium japonicum SEMIA 5079]